MAKAAAWRAHLDRHYFRYLRYLLYTLKTDFFFGTPETRSHFLGRLADAAGKLPGIECLRRSAFLFRLKISTFFAKDGSRLWRNRNWLWAINGVGIKEKLALWEDDNPTGRPIRALVFGAGGIGDLIQTTPILAALRQKLPDAEIIFLHRSPAVCSFYADNPHVNACGFASFGDAARLRKAIALEGRADFMLEIESGTYVGTYTLAPSAKRAPQLAHTMPDSVFYKATGALQLRRNTPTFRQPDGTYHWPDEWKGLSYLDVIGTTTGLPVNRHSSFDFPLTEEALAFAASVTPNQNIITVQNGVDDAVVKWMHVTGRYASKLMPLSLWRDTVQLLVEAGYCVVQLGTENDAAIEGVTIDLRGKTDLQQAGAVLKRALAHVGTEGGLIHLARAVGTKSVVVFGPTSVEFFGYDENINLTADTCNSCWLSSRDWYIYCPRGFLQPPCMSSHDPYKIVKAVRSICGNEITA